MKYILTILSFFLGIAVSAQNISVTDFYLDQMDQTSNLQGTTVLDQNGEKCAVIKILTTQTGFTFDVGMLGIQKVVQKSGEIWVYVPSGIRRISISHPTIGQLRDYQIPVAISKARTYIMKITAANVRTVIEEQETAKYLILSVMPKRATVLIDGKPVMNDGGSVMSFLPFGLHTYKVMAPGYYDEDGTVDLKNDGETKFVKEVTLKANKANITVTCPTKNAEIWINNHMYGTGTWKGAIAAGTYAMEARIGGCHGKKVMQTISSANDGQTITLPAPEVVYGKLNVNVRPVGAKIYVDGVENGTTPNIVKVIVGEHNVTIKKEGYSDYTEKVTVEEGRIKQLSASLTQGASQAANAAPDVTPKSVANSQSSSANATETIPKEVKSLYLRALKGDDSAQRDLANCYYNGKGVEKNMEKAFEWYQKAAVQGNASAQYGLARSYFLGKGTEKNSEKGVEWLLKAVQQNYPTAQYRLGQCYYKGEGVQQNYAEAVKWFQKAASRGKTPAIYNLGKCYEKGHGVEVDKEKAIELYKKTVKQDPENQNAKDALKRLGVEGY